MASQSVSSSKRSKRSSADDVEKGPLMVNGTLFTRIRRCPCCLLKNSDSNVFLTGFLSISLFLVWARGTCENPEGAVCKLCSMTFWLAGFSAEHASIEAYLEERKLSPVMMKEWQAAYDKLKQHCETTDKERMGKQVRAVVMGNLSEARQKVVQAFRSTQVKVGSNFKAICAKKYEKDHPGEIARKGLAIHTIETTEGKKEVVYVRKGKKDEWDVSFETLCGVNEVETHDDGEIQLRGSQTRSKYDVLAKKNKMDKSALEGIASEASSGNNDQAEGDTEHSDDSGNDTPIEDAKNKINK